MNACTGLGILLLGFPAAFFLFLWLYVVFVCPVKEKVNDEQRLTKNINRIERNQR